MKEKKIDFQKLLNETIHKEELANILYTRHLKEAFYWSGIKEPESSKILNGLKNLERNSREHLLKLQVILNRFE